MKRKKRVLVAMSGGVDSSVAASLLKEEGYEVIGMMMQVWDYSKKECDLTEGFGTCCSSIDVQDAKKVSFHLDIPFYVANCEAKFQTYVIDSFTKDYLDGKTPIPCIHCNTYLKFDHLIKKMNELNCDYLATGHYAKVSHEKEASMILTSRDPKKDQTYFLFTLDKKILPKIIFPVGDWTKEKIRDYALKRKLPVASKKDSTGICFINQKGGYTEFIESSVDKNLLKPGKIRKEPDGEILGEHSGIHRFTLGQRKGFHQSFSSEALYVSRIDVSKNEVWLGEEKYLFKRNLPLEKCNWLDEVPLDKKVKVKIRFGHKGAFAKIKKTKKGLNIIFDEEQRSICPGQAAVIYEGKKLLGGGWIGKV